MARNVGKPTPDDFKRVAVAALVAALDDGKDQATEEARRPEGMGVRRSPPAPSLYTAGKAAFKGAGRARTLLDDARP